MKKVIYLSLLLASLGTTSPAMAQNWRYDGPDSGTLKTLGESLIRKHVDLKIAEIERATQSARKDVAFGEAGLGIGATAGSNTTTGATASTAAGFHVRSFQEGTNENYSLGLPFGLYDYEEGIDAKIKKDATKELEDLLHSKGYDDETVRYAINGAYDHMKATIRANRSRIQAASDKFNQASRESYKKQRPMHFFEGNAQYNMIGTQAHGGAFTGVTGDIRGGVGFSLKDSGKNGCDIYFMATGKLTGQGHYNASSLDSFGGAAGIEQGLLCQVNDAVTFMASPSVQVGGLRHALPNSNIQNKDGAATTDWLNYAARGRLILNDRMYLSGEFVHHPDMKSGSAHWKATEVSGNVDFKVNDKWVVGARVKNLRMQDTQGQNADINDTQVAVQAFRAF